MEKAKGKKAATLEKIKMMPQIEMTKVELRWLRRRMESEDIDIKEAAELAHRTMLPFLSDYSSIKDSALTKLEFYVQGDMDDYPSEVEIYRHVHYAVNVTGYISRIVLILYDWRFEYESK
jgi:hypothetical protein